MPARPIPRPYCGRPAVNAVDALEHVRDKHREVEEAARRKVAARAAT